MCRGGGALLLVPVLTLLAMLAGCQVTGSHGPRIGHLAVVGDEPQAVLNGREVLVTGGNAADAAVAMAMTMVATLPSRVGLGGGGVCLVYNPANGTIRALDFLPRAAPGGGAPVPGLLRGLFVLHAENGRARWESLLAPAENLARFGHPVSRTLAADLAAAGPAFAASAGGAAGGGRAAAGPFAGPGGAPLREGETLHQPELATLLAEVRGAGVGAFYTGATGRRFAEAAGSSGLSLTIEALRGYQARAEAALTVDTGNDTLAFPPWPEAGGPAQAAIRTALHATDYGSLSPPDRAQRLLAAERQAAGDGSGFGTTIAATSADGMAVACGFTLNGLFGSGRLVPGTGSFIAAPPPPGAVALGGIALLVNLPLQKTLFAGGGDSVAALAMPLAELLLAGRPAAEALAAPRLAPDPAGPGVLVESRADLVVIAALQQAGGPVRTVEALGRANAIRCDWDRRADTTNCTAAADPRGSGLALSGETRVGGDVRLGGARP